MATAILFEPGITASESKQSAWIVPIFSSVIVLITLCSTWKLGLLFPQQTLPQYNEIILGKTLGKLLSSGYVLFFFIVNVLVVREFSTFFAETFMPNTPLIVLNLAIVLVGGYAAFKGIEVIARIAQFVLPIFIFSLVIIFVLAAPGMNWDNLLPLFEGGIRPIVKSSVVTASWYGEIAVLVMLMPMVNKPKEVMHRGVWMLIAVAGFLSAGTLVTLTIFGPNQTGDLLFPYWYLARYVEFPKFFQRVEFVALLWITGIVVKTALFYYLTCLTTAQVLGLKSYKALIFPAGAVQVMVATFLISNSLQLNEILDKWWPPFGLFFELLLPIVLLLLAIIKEKQGSVLR